jgi:hypothetical protein
MFTCENKFASFKPGFGSESVIGSGSEMGSGSALVIKSRSAYTVINADWKHWSAYVIPTGIGRSQLHGFQSQVRELTSQLEEREVRLASLNNRLHESNQIRTELIKTKVKTLSILHINSSLHKLQQNIPVQKKIKCESEKLKKVLAVHGISIQFLMDAVCDNLYPVFFFT